MNRDVRPNSDPAYDSKLQAALTRAWEAAAMEPRGVAIPTHDPDALRRHLYVWRRKAQDAGDRRFDHLQLFKAPAPAGTEAEEIWIIPKPGDSK